jgi:hypothetical protein
MKSRVMAFAAAIIILVGVLGCATEREAQYTTTGAGIGAVTGALLGAALGSLSGHAGQGAVVGSVFGGLAGASIGNNEYHMQRSEEAAADYYAYNQQQAVRDLLRIEDASVNPSQANPGDEVTMSATFTILTPSRGTQLVHEVREVRHNGKLIGRPHFTSRRAGGTWVSSMPIKLPLDAEPGTYTVTTIVETDNAGDTRETDFKVVSGSQWRR